MLDLAVQLEMTSLNVTIASYIVTLYSACNCIASMYALILNIYSYEQTLNGLHVHHWT